MENKPYSMCLKQIIKYIISSFVSTECNKSSLSKKSAPDNSVFKTFYSNVTFRNKKLETEN